MYFSRILALVATLSLAAIALAGPTHRRSFEEESTDLLEREPISNYEHDLAIRALTEAQRGARAARAIRKQNDRKDTRRAMRTAGRPSKADRAAKWAAVKGTSKQPKKMRVRAEGKRKPPKPSRAPRPSKLVKMQNREAVRAHLRWAGEANKRMKNTLPGRTDTFVHGTGDDQVIRTGKDVRKAVFNSKVHEAAPVGGHAPAGVKGNPKHFGNYRYRDGPIDGKTKPLESARSGTYSGLKEYPLTNTKAGWHGERRPGKGPARVITSNDRFHGAVTHGQGGNHVPMTHLPDTSDWATNLETAAGLRP